MCVCVCVCVDDSSGIPKSLQANADIHLNLGHFRHLPLTGRLTGWLAALLSVWLPAWLVGWLTS
jgi:hypothetical protein